MEEAQNEDSECSPRSITPLVPDVPDGPSEREEESKYTSVMAVFAVTSPPIVDPPVQYAVFDPKATKVSSCRIKLHDSVLSLTASGSSSWSTIC